MLTHLSPSAFSQISRGDKAVLQYTAGNSEAATEGKAHARIVRSISVSLSYLQFRVPFFLNSSIAPGMRERETRRNTLYHLFMTRVRDARVEIALEARSFP